MDIRIAEGTARMPISAFEPISLLSFRATILTPFQDTGPRSGRAAVQEKARPHKSLKIFTFQAKVFHAVLVFRMPFSFTNEIPRRYEL